LKFHAKNINRFNLQKNKDKKVSNFLELSFDIPEEDDAVHHRLAGVLERSSAKKRKSGIIVPCSKTMTRNLCQQIEEDL